jgi:Txe/YoeB family toxin of Txe-Axe toxin-antitoxin module
MPKEKSIFLIGVWIIVLSHFIGIGTEVKNYLFIATGVLLIFISYGSYIIKKWENKEAIEPSQKEEIPSSYERVETTSIEPKKVKRRIMEVFKETEAEPMMSSISYEEIKKEYEPKIKVRKARIKATHKIASENSYTFPETEDDDVVVISSGREE